MSRIGVFVCHCGTNISGKVDVVACKEFASKLPGVEVAQEYKFMCSDPGQQLVVDAIREHKLDRVVVAACSPTMHEKTFRGACERAGLNKYLFHMANVREHCSWVTEDPAKATEKAKTLIAGGVAKAAKLEPLKTKTVPIKPSCLVVGGGIAGIQAALDIADSGKKVYLVERDTTIGGHMALFDKTFPTLDCAACILTPKMVSVAQHKNIQLMAYSEIEEVTGYVGNFHVKIRQKAKYVVEDKCTGCGICQEKCPKKAKSEFEQNMMDRKAIYMAFPQAVPKIPVIDKESCIYFKTGKCKVCQKFCPRECIDFEQQDKMVEVDVGSIILTTGFKPFDGKKHPAYGYGKYPEVYSALEFERMNSASGSTGGDIKMKNGEKPRAVGIIHCVGSRDKHFNEHCSRVCCMYSLKFAHLIKEKAHGCEVYNFYIDMRCFGKGYEEFYNRLLHEDVRFVRGRAASVSDFALTEEEKGRLVIRVEDTLIGQVRRIPVDMVILANGLEPREDSKDVARKFNISCGNGFFMEKHPKLAPVSTPTDGVFIAGACQGAKDIPDTVAQASGAAAQVLSMMMRGSIEIESATATIVEEKCSGCRVCNPLCPYTAISFDEKKNVSVVNDALCKGCGTCVAACPSAAIRGQHFTDDQIMSEVEGVLYDVVR